MKVILIDANALINRLYHALPILSDPLGRPIQAVYGLANILLKILKEEKPDYIFALYDRPEPTIRHQAFKEYKAQRPKATEDLIIQISLSKKIFFAFKIPFIEKIGYEADDLIASLKEKFSNISDEIIILTGDLDTLQLVDEKTKVLTMKKGISQTNIYDISKVKERFEILPEQIPDYKALIGDASDNIPGISGIGPKTAAKILTKFKNLEGIYEAIKENKIEKDLAKKFLENKEKIFFYRDLVTLKKDIEIDENLIKKYEGYNNEDLIKVFQEFGFRSLIKRIKPDGETQIKLVEIKKISPGLFNKDLEQLENEIFIYLENNEIKIVESSGEIKKIDEEELKEIFLSNKIKFVFDLKNIFKKIFVSDFYFDKKIDLSKIYDLKIIFWLLNPEKGGYSLENIIYYFQPNAEQPLSLIFPTSKILLNKLKENNLEKLYFEIELPLTGILARTELRGIKIDLNVINEFKQKLKEDINNLLNEIYNLAGERFNVNSPSQLRKVLFEKLKIKTKGLSKTDKGEISTQESELLKIKNEHPIIEKILAYRKLNKFLTTYTDSLLKNYDLKTGKIYTIFNQTRARAGRLISESPNLQNLPVGDELAKILRRAFKSEEGFVFVSFDYSQIELRILAHLSQDENLINAFLKNIDIHSQTAKMIFGNDSPQNRRKAKIINFSIIYGTTAKGLAERLQIPISQAKNLIERFFYFYPGVLRLKKDLIDFAKTYSYVETLFGRKRFIPEINSLSYREKSLAERIAINMPIQGLGADLIKKAMIEIDKEIYQRNLQNKVYFILLIHDEIIFEVKKEIKEEIKVIIREKMENVIKLNVPLKVEIKEAETLNFNE